MSNGRVVLLVFVVSAIGAFVGASLVGPSSGTGAAGDVGQQLAVTQGFDDVRRRLDRLEERLGAVVERSVGGRLDAGDVDVSDEPAALDVPAPSPAVGLTDDDLARLAEAVEQAVVRAQSGVVESRPLDVDAVEEIWARLGRPSATRELQPPQPHGLQWTYMLDADRQVVVKFAGGLVTTVHPPL